MYCVFFLSQSAAIAQELESTHNSLQEATSELYKLQQLLQQERSQHSQQLADLSAEVSLSTQQLQSQHEQQVQELQAQQREQVAQLQMVQQRLDGELAEAKAQLAAVMLDLEEERNTSGQLHKQVARLHHEFEDARK